MSKTKKETTKTDTAKVERKPSLIYCGPNIGFKALKNTVYVGGTPKILENEIKECKEIEKLFVPVSMYSKVKQALNNEGSLESLYYKTVEGYLKNKRGDI